MDAILREHPPPAAGLLAGRLGSPESRGSGSAFPAFYTALLEPRNAEEETQKKQLHSDLMCALAENPAPAIPVICHRLVSSRAGLTAVIGTWPTLLRPDIYSSAPNRWSNARGIYATKSLTIVKDMLDRGERPINTRYQEAHCRFLEIADNTQPVFQRATGSLETPKGEDLPEWAAGGSLKDFAGTFHAAVDSLPVGRCSI